MLAAVFLRIRELSFPSGLWQEIELNRQLLLIRSGRIVEAIALLQETRPELLVPGSTVYLSLHAQVFIELLRERKTLAAVHRARQTFGTHKDAGIKTRRGSVTVRDLMGLLCTREPEDSAVGFLMSQEQREVVCTVLRHSLPNGNSAMVQTS